MPGADAYVGMTTTRELRLEDVGGVPITDAVVTYTLTGADGTVLLTAQPVPHSGDGWYAVLVDGGLLATPGRYLEAWTSAEGTTLAPWNDAFQVDYADGPVHTRLDIRHTVARLCADLWLGVVDSAGAASLVDSARTLEPDHHWRGMYCTVYGGAGRGQDRQVLDSVQATGTLTLSRPWGTVPAAGSRYELHRRWPTETYNDLLNQALHGVSNHALVPAVDETIALSDNLWEYRIPADFQWIVSVWRRNATAQTPPNDWEELFEHRRDWSLVRGRRVLRLRQPATNYRLRLVGLRTPPTVERDASFVTVEPEYLVPATAALLHQSLMTGAALDRDAMGVKAQMFQTQAQANAPSVRPPRGSVRL